MIVGLHYADESDRAHALVSVAKRCAELDTRLVFVACEASCARLREHTRALAPLCPGRSASVRFYPLPHAARPTASPAAPRFEAIRSALWEIASMDAASVIWIDVETLGQPSAGLLEGLRSHDDRLWRPQEAEGRYLFLLVSCSRSQTPANGLALLFAGTHLTVSADLLIPRCPSWLLGWPRKQEDSTPACGVPTLPDDLATQTADLIRAEKLVALGQLAAGIAHELGNPLSIISSSLQYLHQRLVSTQDPACDFTAAALENAERMQALLRSMLDAAASKEPVSDLLDLNETISELIRFTSAECRRRSIAVEVAFDPCLPRIWGDKNSIKQVFLNLIRNAFDALPPIGGNLVVRTRAACARSAARIEFENDGPPIPPEVLPELFRPFYTTKDSGTGLGLYLSRRICHDHGGNLEVDSLHRGARFVVTLSGRTKKESAAWQRC